MMLFVSLFCFISLLISESESLVKTVKFFEDQNVSPGDEFNITIPISSFYSSDDQIYMRIDESTLPSWLEVTKLPPTHIINFDTGTKGMIRSQVIRHPYIYSTASFSNKFVITDISDLNNVFVASEFDLGHYVISLVIEGDVAYVGELYDHLVLLNISDPYNISELSSSTENFDLSYGSVVKDGYCFICDYTAGVFRVYDVSNPKSISKVAEKLVGTCRDIAISENGMYLYVATEPILMLYDVSNPSNPQPTGDLDQTGKWLSVFSRMKKGLEDYVFVGDWWKGLHIIDVSDPSDPQNTTVVDVQGNLVGLSVGSDAGDPYGDFVYITREDRSIIYDISDIYHPSLVYNVYPFNTSITTTTNSFEKNLFATGNIEGYIEIFEIGSLRLNGTVSEEGCRKEVITVTAYTKTGPQASTSFEIFTIGPFGNAVDEKCSVFVCNGTLSNDTDGVVCHGRGNCTYTIDDSSGGLCECEGLYDPKTLCSSCLKDVFGENCEIDGRYVKQVKPLMDIEMEFGESRTIKIPIDSFESGEEASLFLAFPRSLPSWIEVSDPCAIEYKSSIDTSLLYHNIYDVQIEYPYIFMTTYDDKKLVSIDATNTSNLIILDEFSTSDVFYHFLVIDSIAYIPQREGNFLIVNVSDPYNMEELGMDISQTFTQAYDLSKNGEYVYVADSEYIKVFDCSDLTNPFHVTSIGPISSCCRAVSSVDDVMFAQGSYTLTSYNISNLLSVGSPLDALSGITNGVRILTFDGYSYVLDYNQGLRIASTSDSHDLSFQGFFPSLYLHDIAIGGPDNNFVFMADANNQKLVMIDISEKNNPIPIHSIDPHSVVGPEAVEISQNVLVLSGPDGIDVHEVGSVMIDVTVPNDISYCGKHTISVTAVSNLDSSHFFNTSFQVYVSGGNVLENSDCSIFKCNGILSNDSSVCHGGRGNCSLTLDSANGSCECLPRFLPPFCGTCSAGLTGGNCHISQCFGILANDTENVCSGHGNCTGPNQCQCQHNYTFEECQMWYCNHTERNETDVVCSGHGFCVAPEECVCENSTKYFSPYCEHYTCFGIMNNDSNACSQHGECVDYDSCQCHKNFTGEDCWYHECFGYGVNDTRKCSSHGDCVDHDICDCFEDYAIAEDCSIWECDSILSSNSKDVCSGHGNCISAEECSCLHLYSGKFCQFWSCFGVPVDNVDDVCFGHGACVAFDLCGCQSGYSNKQGEFGEVCDYWTCSHTGWDLPGVCSGRGNCTLLDSCECEGEYEGDNCETWSCGGIDQNLENVCSGNGNCSAPEKCDCNGGFSGDECSVNVILIAISAPAGVIFSLFLICCCACCACLCLILFCICVVFLLTSLSVVLFQQKIKMQKFGKLKNFELLLREQEADSDGSVAHLRIKKGLFEIKFEEIHIEKILGEGGSDSIVYLATWGGQKIAFKCFKTRSICSDQDRFDEFEKEVEIFSSISHPSIVRFFGCTMKVPRVGILMEFCENGEMLDFVCSFRKKNETGYLIKEKIRMLEGVSNGMEYLHGRNIIHRDLKCENVLIDSRENPKIMDFGLSKIAERMSQVKTTRVGTSYYMAPEVILDARYTEKCDVFSFSIMCYVLLAEMSNPYEEESETYGIEFKVANNKDYRPDTSTLKKILTKEGEEEGGEDYEWMLAIIKLGWTHEYKYRPSFKDLNELFSARGSKEAPSFVRQLIDDNEEKKRVDVNKNHLEGEVVQKLKEKVEDLENDLKNSKETIEKQRLEIEKLKKKIDL